MQKFWKLVKQIWSYNLIKILIIFFIIYKLIFNSITGKLLIEKGFSSISPAKLELEVKKFSLFYGIEIHNLQLQTEQTPLLKVSRLAVLYNLPMLFLGRVKISEIALENPEIYLKKQNDKWNFETVFPSEEKKEEELQEEPKSSLSEINLYLPVSAFFYFHIDNLSTTLEIEEKENFTYAQIKNFNLSTQLNTFRFSKIPLSLDALKSLEIFDFALNPHQAVLVFYKDKEQILDTELNLKLLLKKEFLFKKEIYSSQMLFAPKKFLIQSQGGKEIHLNFEIGYDLNFEPTLDELKLKNLRIIFEKEKWLYGEGAITKLSSDTPDIDFVVHESNINLSSLSSSLRSIPSLSQVSLGGNLSLAGISAKGDMDHLYVNGKILGNGIFFKDNKTNHRIPKLNLIFFSHLNLSDKASSTEADLLPILENFKLEILNIVYNGIDVKLFGEVQPKSKVDLTLDISNILLESYVKDLFGNFKLHSHITGNKLSYLNLDIRSEINGLKYKVGRGISGYQKILISLATVIDLAGGFKFEDMQIEPLDISIWNENKEKAISLISHLDLDMKSGLKLSIQGLQLSGNMTKLLPTLPLGLKNLISAVRSNLGNELKLGGNLSFESFKEKDHIFLNLTGSFPAIELKDLHVNLDLNLHKNKAQTIEIHRFYLDGFDKKLKADCKGEFYKPFTANPPYGDLTGFLKGNFTLESEDYKYILKGVYFKGDLDLDFEINQNLISGKLHTKDSYFKITNPCPQEPCPIYELKGLHLDIPFVHDVLDKTTENLIQGNKENFVQNYGHTQNSNFWIQSISGPHPGKPNLSVEFISPKNGYPGLSGRLDYMENFLVLDNLRIFSLNGTIFGKDILFNVGSGNPEEMQFAGIFQIRDMDFKELLDEKAKSKIDDGKIKADLNFSGKNLKDPIGNMDLYFTIFQIGKDFGKSVVNIVSPTNIITDFIINSYSINKVEVELSKGLVYAKIQFDKTIVNKLFFEVEDDRIKQERIPLSSFLNRAKNELEAYNN